MRPATRTLTAGALALGTLAGTVAAQASPPERLFLQKLTPHSAVLKWRGGDATRACFSKNRADLQKPHWPRCVDAVETEGGHREARLTGLAPNQTWYYSVGGYDGDGQQFRTPTNSNKPPRDGNTHMLIIGDSGTQSETNLAGVQNHVGEAAAVLAGFNTYNAANGGEAVDVLLALGDTAYVAGTDAQWQTAFFGVYPDILKSAFTLTTIGNHEMGFGTLDYCAIAPLPCGLSTVEGTSVSADPASWVGVRPPGSQPDGSGPPYLSIFSLPALGESGGVPSGTEQYYSVDYNNVHIVSLDSQLTARDPDQREAMRQWLIDDLAQNDRDWTVVIFHHPPYTKGANHDSDDTELATPGLGAIDRPEWDMRNEFTPIFDEYGVDVVYSGHSHSYERSFYLRGHTGKSDTFSAAEHAELNADGGAALGYGDETYRQLSPTSGGIDDRVVYTVAGSAGKADARGGFSTTAEEWLRHPAHVPQATDALCTGNGLEGCRNGLPVRGSVVLDASGKALTAKFVDETGAVRDQFTIRR